jgi:hypothetical protein
MSAQKDIAELKQEVGGLKGLIQSAIDLFKGGKQSTDPKEEMPEDEETPEETEESTEEESEEGEQTPATDEASQLSTEVAGLAKQVQTLIADFKQAKGDIGKESEQKANKIAAQKIRSATSTPLAQANDKPGQGKPAAAVDGITGVDRVAATFKARANKTK